MIAPAALSPTPESSSLRVWGLSPLQLHDAFWNARGVAVVRQGTPQLPHDSQANSHLLLGAYALVLLDLQPAANVMNWLDPSFLCMRIYRAQADEFAAQEIEQPDGPASYYQPVHPLPNPPRGRVGLTTRSDIAREWRRLHPRHVWSELRRTIPQTGRAVRSFRGFYFDSRCPEQASRFVGHLAAVWRRPNEIIDRAEPFGANVWKDEMAILPKVKKSRFPIWLGIGRNAMPSNLGSKGPVVLWDNCQDLARHSLSALNQRSVQSCIVE